MFLCLFHKARRWSYSITHSDVTVDNHAFDNTAFFLNKMVRKIRSWNLEQFCGRFCMCV